MEERKKQILLEKLTEYNKTVNNISKFQLNKREEKLFCEIMQQFADEYHSEQLRQYNISSQSEQLNCEHEWKVEGFDCYGFPISKYCEKCNEKEVI